MEPGTNNGVLNAIFQSARPVPHMLNQPGGVEYLPFARPDDQKTGGQHTSTPPQDIFTNDPTPPDPYAAIRGIVNGEQVTLRSLITPRHEVPSSARSALYREIPSHLQTELTKTMITISRFMEFVEGLTEVDIKKGRIQRKIREWMERLPKLAETVIRYYTEEGLRPLRAILRLMDEAYAERDATAIRIDLDIARLNKQDPTGSLADEYIPALGRWLTKNIERDEEAKRLFRDFRPVVIRLPERTSFLIAGSNREQGALLVRLVMEKLKGLEKDIREELIRLQSLGKIAKEVDLTRFSPTGVVHYTTMPLGSFMTKYKAAKQLESARRIPRPVASSKVMDEIARLNAETVLLKEARPQQAMLVGGFTVYGHIDPIIGGDENMLRGLEEYIRERKGTIPLGRYGYEGEKDPYVKSRERYPDLTHAVAEITRPIHIKGGGSLEYLTSIIQELISGKNPSLELLEQLKRAAKDLVQRLLNMGEEGRRDSQYLMLMKPTRTMGDKNANFFVEQVGLIHAFLQRAGVDAKYNVIAAIELDDMKASLGKYPPRGDVDTRFQGYRELVFKVFEELGLLPPVIAAEGDQIRIAYSTRRIDGTEVDPELPLRVYQQRLKRSEASKKRYFQPTVKVEVGGEVQRLPLWIKEDGSYVPSRHRPNGARPYMKTVTATVAWTHADFSTARGVERIDPDVRRLYQYIDELKGKNGPRKEGLGRLSN